MCQVSGRISLVFNPSQILDQFILNSGAEVFFLLPFLKYSISHYYTINFYQQDRTGYIRRTATPKNLSTADGLTTCGINTMQKFRVIQSVLSQPDQKYTATDSYNIMAKDTKSPHSLKAEETDTRSQQRTHMHQSSVQETHTEIIRIAPVQFEDV